MDAGAGGHPAQRPEEARHLIDLKEDQDKEEVREAGRRARLEELKEARTRHASGGQQGIERKVVKHLPEGCEGC